MVIYKTTNLINGKIYIGQDSNNDAKYLGSGLLLNYAIKKYGKENFIKEILQTCESKSDLNKFEKHWIQEFNSTDKRIGYNISEGGTGGKLVPIEGKKGKTYEEYYGDEKAAQLKQLFSEIRKGRKLGYKNITSEEVGKKISDALKNRQLPEEHKKNVANGLKKFYQTDEGIKMKEIIKLRNTGRVTSDKTKEKQRLALKGKKPKSLDVHPSAKYWYFYNKDNELIYETLGNRTQTLKELGTNQRRIVIFENLNECLSYKLESNKDFKLYSEKYYKTIKN